MLGLCPLSPGQGPSMTLPFPPGGLGSTPIPVGRALNGCPSTRHLGSRPSSTPAHLGSRSSVPTATRFDGFGGRKPAGCLGVHAGIAPQPPSHSLADDPDLALQATQCYLDSKAGASGRMPGFLSGLGWWRGAESPDAWISWEGSGDWWV